MIKIPECLAFERCQAKKADCEVCQELTIPEWTKHVKKILKKAGSS